MGKCSPKNPFKNSWVHSWQNLWKFLDATKRKIPVLRNLESKSKFWKPKPLACGLALMHLLQISSLVEPQVFSQNSDGFKISSPDVSLKTVSGASALYFWGSMSMWLFAWIVDISHLPQEGKSPPAVKFSVLCSKQQATSESSLVLYLSK